ncbi:hypothetical protein LCGC14_0665340 [marine sediment metagenome]|uniref:Uncharacterized protein n=1 Tax=marine sediment metagenome TaxID=412755 RepID=A0A0F9U0K7_9ZZZZ
MQRSASMAVRRPVRSSRSRSISGLLGEGIANLSSQDALDSQDVLLEFKHTMCGLGHLLI